MTDRRRLVDRLGLDVALPSYLQRGSKLRRWLSLTVRSALTVFDVGFLVAGTGLIGVGLGLVLNGFGVVDLVVDNDLGQALAVGLVITMIGGFMVGIAVEGPIGNPGSAMKAKPWEALLAAVPALVAFIWVVGLLERLADRLLVPYSELFLFVSSHLNAVQQTGITVGLLVGIPAMWATRQFLAPRLMFFDGAAPGALYLVWMIGVISAYQPII